jgi:hypothetical protein
MSGFVRRFRVGEDFTEEEFNKWKKQLKWWISSSMPKVADPAAHTEKVLLSAMNGTKLNGEAWTGISNDFIKRVTQLTSFDLKTGVGRKAGRGGRPRLQTNKDKRVGPKITPEELPPEDIKTYFREQEQYKKDLLIKYPHLENPIYNPKVDELAETVMKSRMLSQEFLLAKGEPLLKLSKLRESLHKQIGELMDFLEISPKLLVHKQKEAAKADVGSLIAQMETYGEIWQEYERIDALRELIQKYKQLKTLRPDGSPQLNDWELWHQTRNRPVKFTCRCGETYELLGGFTPDEIEEALVQAYKAYGFGLEPIEGKDHKLNKKVNENVLRGEFILHDAEDDDNQ